MLLPERPFLGCPAAGDLAQLDADVVVLGIPLTALTATRLLMLLADSRAPRTRDAT